MCLASPTTKYLHNQWDTYPTSCCTGNVIFQWRVCPALPAQQYNLRSRSVAPNKKFELSGLMTFRSNAAECERDQVGTNTSAGRVLSFVEVSPQPLSISRARQALRQKSAKQSQRRLCLVTTSPPEQHIRGLGSSVGRHLHLWRVEAQATISIRLGLHWAGLTQFWRWLCPQPCMCLGSRDG